jgi:hypothetical protein
VLPRRISELPERDPNNDDDESKETSGDTVCLLVSKSDSLGGPLAL